MHELGLTTALATSSPADELDSVLDVLDIADVVDAMTTADDIETSKPDPEVFLTAMKVASLDPSRTLAIGDSVWDVEAARRGRDRLSGSGVRRFQSTRAQ